jgi:hypothetical protein
MDKDAIVYSVWVVHRENAQSMGGPLKCKQMLLQFMKDLYVQMNLSYEQKILPVTLVTPDKTISSQDSLDSDKNRMKIDTIG